MSNIVLASLGENIKASTAGQILASSGPTTAPTLNALVGSIALFAGTTPPAGWLKCDGTGDLLRSQYQALWNFAFNSNNIVDETSWLAGRIGSFSTGNGSTTFRIPDLRGEFVRALADGKAVDTGRVIGSSQGDAIRNITGNLGATVTWIFADGAFSSVFARTSLGGGTFGLYDCNFDASRVVPTAQENRPRNIALLYCIKF